MSRTRFLLKQLLKLSVAAACLAGTIAAYRLLLHPLIASVFSLGEHASSIVRRVNLFAVVALSYWGFVQIERVGRRRGADRRLRCATGSRE